MLYNCIIFTPGELEGLILFIIDKKSKNKRFVIFNFSQDNKVTEILKRVRAERSDLRIYEIKNKPLIMKALVFLMSAVCDYLLLSYPASNKKNLQKLCAYYRNVYLFRDSVCPYINSVHFDLKKMNKNMIYEKEFIKYDGVGIFTIGNNIKDYVQFWTKNELKTKTNNEVLIFTKYVDQVYEKDYSDTIDKLILTLVKLGFQPIIFKHPRASPNLEKLDPFVDDSYYMKRLSGCRMIISFHSSVSYIFYNFSESHVVEVFDNKWFKSGKDSQSRFKKYTHFSGNSVAVLDYLDRLPHL